MRQVNLAFVHSDAFKKWQQRAHKVRARVLAEGTAHVFQPQVWKGLKNLLIGWNHGKCMYCEFKGTAADYYAAEHYRPKSEVTEERSRIAHDGYYWLAYEWQNILLACTKCNSSHPDGERGSHPGKATEFPISKSRIPGPGPDPDKWIDDLVVEEPLLLHPYFDKAEDHFKNGKFGALEGTTIRGKATIKVCDLNRPALREARERAHKEILTKIAKALDCHSDGRSPADLWYCETDQFSTYLNCFLEDYFKKMLRSKRRA
jgi:5-methylcytosine-specific restriction endonuclease McrA